MQLPRVSLAVTVAVLRGIVLPAPVSAEARTELAEDDQLDLAHASALGLQRSHSLEPAPASAEAGAELVEEAEQLDLARTSALGLQRSHSLEPAPVSEQFLAELVEEAEPLDWTHSSVLGLQRSHSMLIRRNQRAAAEAPRVQGGATPRRSMIRVEAPSTASPAQQPTV